jgi:hypothetical protein
VLIARLSALVARARSAVTGAHAPLWRDFIRFWTVSFPVVAYRAWRWWLATAVVFTAVAVLIALPALLWLNKQSYAQRVIQVLSAIVMLVGLGLFIERLMMG